MITGFGNEYAVTSAAFTLPVGAVSKAIRGENAWFVIRPVNRVVASAGDFAKNPQSTMQALSQRLRNGAFGSWFQKVRERAEIKDKRFSSDN